MKESQKKRSNSTSRMKSIVQLHYENFVRFIMFAYYQQRGRIFDQRICVQLISTMQPTINVVYKLFPE